MKKEPEQDPEFKQVSSELLAEVRELYGKVMTLQTGKPTVVTAEATLLASMAMLKNYCEEFLKQNDPEKH